MKKIIMVEGHEYNSVFKLGSHNYAELFSKNNYKVLWLSPIYNHLIWLVDKEKFKYKQKLNNKIFTKVHPNIYTYAPYSIFLYGNYPFCRSKLLSKLTVDFILPNLKKTLRNNEFEEVDILWISNPKFLYLKDIIKYKKLVYRCADDLSQFNFIPKSTLELEEQLLKEADDVFVSSYNLMQKKSHIRSNMIYLPNGVNIENFIRKTYTMPKEYTLSKNNRCIYVGAIDKWFDSKLVEYCAKKLKHIEFYLIGPVKANLECLEKLKNIKILGKKDYKDIPNYLKFSDVAIIPFKVNKLTDSVNPIKLYEYMSLGLNVVSTNFKEMKYIESNAYVANNYDQFSEYILKAIENKNKNIQNNISFAKENTWESRIKIILSTLKD